MVKISSQTPSVMVTPSTQTESLSPLQKSQDVQGVGSDQFEVGGAVSGDVPVGAGGAGAGLNGVIGGQSLLSLLLQGASKPEGAHLFDLNPKAMSHSVGLNQVLQSLSSSPEGKGVIQQLIQGVQAQTGIEIPPGTAEAVLRDPERFTDVLMLEPGAMSQGFQALNAKQALAATAPVEAQTTAAPGALNLDKWDAIPYERPVVEPKQIAPGLWQGSLPGGISDEQAKSNTVMANALELLSHNVDAPAGGASEVTYKGQQYEKLGDFLQALKRDGHEVEVVAVQRVANFADLKTKGPDGQWMDVPAPLFVKTGIKGTDGEEAAIPAIHSELVLRIRSEDNPGGFNADVKWYQGTERTGFYPVGLSAEPKWCGREERPIAKGDKAIETMELAGLFSDVVGDAASEQGLARSGYGMTGVCNDSVAVIEHAMTGKTQAYPLLMQDERLLPELSERMQAGGAGAQRLIDSILDLPSDTTPNETQRERALRSIPWRSGEEPFVSVGQARDILGG